MKTYDVTALKSLGTEDYLDWNGSIWKNVPSINVEEFHPQGSAHRPDVQVKAAHFDNTILILFKVKDRYVRVVQTQRQSSVCLDSCVEFFVWPRPDKGYVNIECNCGGTFLSKYYSNPDVSPEERFKTARSLDDSVLDKIVIKTTMPKTVDPELTDPTEYSVFLSIPVAVYESVIGPLAPLSGQVWRANFYKCGDETSHPHWASWNPIGEMLSFHQPRRFGEIRFL